MDNLFSSPALFRMLRDDDKGAVGTIRTNCKGFPKQLSLRGKRFGPLNWNEIGSIVIEGGKFLALTWIDNAPVQILTKFHKFPLKNTIERM